MRDLIIVGGGAAGLSAAIYALGKQLDFLMIYGEMGGKSDWNQRLADQEENVFRAGSDVVSLFARQLGTHPEHVMQDLVVGITRAEGYFEVETRQHGVQQSTAVIVATGATPVELDAPYARELIGHGLGYSMTTYSHLLTGKSAAVVGTTERALRGVSELSRMAQQVYLIAPDTAGLATSLGRMAQQRPNVEVLEGFNVLEVIGPFHVEEIVVSRGEEIRRMGVDAVFVDLGLRPNSRIVQNLVRTDENGFIWVDDRNATSVPGLFAAGDVTTSFGEQVVIAMGDGSRAALSAYDYLLAEPLTYQDMPMD